MAQIDYELFASLQSSFVTRPGLEPYLDRMTFMAATLVDPPAWCGLTSQHGGWPITVSATEDRARFADQQQYVCGEGPIVDALSTGSLVQAADELEAKRWTHYHEYVVEAGIESMVSIPLKGVDRRTVGALNLYSERAQAFTEADLRYAESCARSTSRGLAQWVRASSEGQLAEGLEKSIVSRALIEEAMGILMCQHHWDAQRAFRRLRSRAGNDARRLRAVAADVIKETTGLPPLEETPLGLVPWQRSGAMRFRDLIAGTPPTPEVEDPVLHQARHARWRTVEGGQP